MVRGVLSVSMAGEFAGCGGGCCCGGISVYGFAAAQVDHESLARGDLRNYVTVEGVGMVEFQ